MQKVVLVASPKKNALIQFIPPDYMPPSAQHIGTYTCPITEKKYHMFGFGEASPKWKKK